MFAAAINNCSSGRRQSTHSSYTYQDGVYRHSTGAGSVGGGHNNSLVRAESKGSTSFYSGNGGKRQSVDLNTLAASWHSGGKQGSRRNMTIDVQASTTPNEQTHDHSRMGRKRSFLLAPPDRNELRSDETRSGKATEVRARRVSILAPLEKRPSGGIYSHAGSFHNHVDKNNGWFGRFLGRHRDVPAAEWGEWNVFIHPLSPFSQGFQTISGVLLLYSTSITPFLIAFYSEQEGYCGHPPTIEIDVFVDSFFVLEILLNFITGKEDEEHGYYLHKISEVSKKYLRSNFAIDIVSALPFAWAEFTAPDLSCEEQEGSNFISYLRLVRMLRMLRLLKVLKIFNVLRQFFRLSPNWIRLMKSAFTVCMTAHLGGCIWWFIHVLEGKDHVREVREAWNIEDSVSSAYLSGQYYMLATLCTVGYGDISADTDAERVFALFVMLLGATVFAIIISNMSALVKELVSQETILLEEQDACIDYMRKHGNFPVLEARVRKFYRFRILQDRHNFLEEEILEPLPRQLAGPIRVVITRQLLGKTQLFEHMSDAFMDQMLDRLEVCIYAPGEFLFQVGEEPSAMYMIMTGEVEVREPDDGGVNHKMGTLLMTKRQGEILGEVEVIQALGLDLETQMDTHQAPVERSLSANAKGFVEARILSLEAFQELAEQFPDVKNALRDFVSSSAEKIRRASAYAASLSDSGLQARLSGAGAGLMASASPAQNARGNGGHGSGPISGSVDSSGQNLVGMSRLTSNLSGNGGTSGSNLLASLQNSAGAASAYHAPSTSPVASQGSRPSPAAGQSLVRTASGQEASTLAKRGRALSSPTLGAGVMLAGLDEGGEVVEGGEQQAGEQGGKVKLGARVGEGAGARGTIRLYQETVKQYDGPARPLLRSASSLAYRNRKPSVSQFSSASGDASEESPAQAPLQRQPSSRRPSLISTLSQDAREGGQRRGSLHAPSPHHFGRNHHNSGKFWGSSVTDRAKPLVEIPSHRSESQRSHYMPGLNPAEAAVLRKNLDDMAEEIGSMQAQLRSSRMDRRATRAADEEQRLMEGGGGEEASVQGAASAETGQLAAMQRQLERLSNSMIGESKWAFEMGRMERTADRLAMLLEDVRSAVAKLPDTPGSVGVRSPAGRGSMRESSLRRFGSSAS